MSQLRAWVRAGLACGLIVGSNFSVCGQSPELPTTAAPVYASAPAYPVVQAGPPATGFAPSDATVVPTAGEIPHPVQLLPAEPFPPVADQVDLSETDLMKRLQAAETRIKQLETQQRIAAQRDEQANKAIDSLRQRWDKVRDPSITTVDQQTYGSSDKKPSEKKWYDRLSIRGYAQMRWNETMNREPGSAPAQYVGDRSIGDDQNFFLRRARVIISGDVSDRVYVYLQPDFASTPDGATANTNFAQIRDWYADLYLDDCKVNRIRVGQSKVPYGWENMQSSSNRLTLDRNDALNSAVRNERDLGVFYYWTPQAAQDFFKFVLDNGLKGSGNYGVFGFGFYNGQGGSLVEVNDDFHFVSRLTLPYQFSSGQCMEVGIQGYVGEYGTTGTAISPLGVGAAVTPAGTLNSATVVRGIRDQRVAATFVWYPQPIGFQAEWNVGRGPGLNDAQTAVVDRHLYGGYLQTMARIETRRHGILFPFIRYVNYHGGWKTERNSPFSIIDEWEAGTEWQITPQMELTTAVLLTDRTNTTARGTANTLSYNQFEGSVLRFQFQFNY